MATQNCLYCYLPLKDWEKDFHETCSRSFFGTPEPPVLDYTSGQIKDLAEEIVDRSVAVPGVQPKLSLTIETVPGDRKRSRFTIGLWGNFILKPPTETFPNLPENEDLTMHLSELFDIATAGHSLIRLQSGELAYLTKRFDRDGQKKIAMEDMCQLTETLTADKYRSSMEKIGKQITKFSSAPGLDNVRFFEMAIFSFLTGNADMHLKNYSLLSRAPGDIALSPAYDLVSTKVAMPDDPEEIALILNGKKRKLDRDDFNHFANNLKIPIKAVNNTFERFDTKMSLAHQWIDHSFLPDEMKTAYHTVLDTNAAKLK